MWSVMKLCFINALDQVVQTPGPHLAFVLHTKACTSVHFLSPILNLQGCSVRKGGPLREVQHGGGSSSWHPLQMARPRIQNSKTIVRSCSRAGLKPGLTLNPLAPVGFRLTNLLGCRSGVITKSHGVTTWHAAVTYSHCKCRTSIHKHFRIWRCELARLEMLDSHHNRHGLLSVIKL